MNIALPYGTDIKTATADWLQAITTIDMAPVLPLPHVAQALYTALENPIGMEQPGNSFFKPNGTVVIVVSDAFRKTGMRSLIPPLLDYLGEHGVSASQINFLFATGTHRGPTVEEQKCILGESVYQRFKDQLVVHAPHDKAALVQVGTTRRGTPVWINRLVVECDHVILTGTVVLHYFAGFGGGRKSLVPGVAGLATIARNHSLNLSPAEDRLNPAVRIACVEGNPVAEDMAEAASLCRVDFIINTVLNQSSEIAGLFVGEMNAAHAEAADFAKQLYAVPIKWQSDVVIASAGTAKNFVQSHKALFNAFQAVKPGGYIILLAKAPEGYGGNRFEHWLKLGSRENIIRELRDHAEINGQTALSTLEKTRRCWMISDLTQEQVAVLGAEKAKSLPHALAEVRQRLAEDGVERPTACIMPNAAYTVPFVSS